MRMQYFYSRLVLVNKILVTFDPCGFTLFLCLSLPPFLGKSLPPFPLCGIWPFRRSWQVPFFSPFVFSFTFEPGCNVWHLTCLSLSSGFRKNKHTHKHTHMLKYVEECMWENVMNLKETFIYTKYIIIVQNLKYLSTSQLCSELFLFIFVLSCEII